MYDSVSNYIIEWRISRGKMKFEDYDLWDIAFRGIISIVFTSLMIILLGIFFQALFQSILITCVFNILKLYSFGHHFESLEKCSVVSIIYLITLSVISKYTTQYVLYTFFICILLFIFTLKSVPNIPKEDKDKSDKFYILTYILLFLFFIIIDLICIYINSSISLIIANSITIGVISVELFLTKSGFEIFRIIDTLTFRTREGEHE